MAKQQAITAKTLGLAFNNIRWCSVEHNCGLDVYQAKKVAVELAKQLGLDEKKLLSDAGFMW